MREIWGVEPVEHKVRSENLLLRRMRQGKVAGLPLWLYLVILGLTVACMYAGCIPKSLIPAMLVLMVLGEGLAALGNTIPVVKTYLGGSVVCILGGAFLTYFGLIPQQSQQTMAYLINDSGFLIFYLAALITGSLFDVDRGLLLRATVRILPVSLCAIAAGVALSGVFGVLLGNTFWEGVLYIGIPMTSGGMTAGAVPLSEVYSQVLGTTAADILNRIAPATVLGNVVAIIFAAIANNIGRTHPRLTGNGVLVNDGKEVRRPESVTPTLMNLFSGMILAFAFYQLGALCHRFVPIVPTYAWMILFVVIVKCLGLLPREMEDAARAWGQFAIKAWTYACLAGIGFVLIDLNVILKNLTPLYLAAMLAILCAITFTAAFLGKAVGFYPLESAIAAGMCTTNMGGSGNVAVLSSAGRLELLPFAQIVTRSCGALMLTIGGILVQFVG